MAIKGLAADAEFGAQVGDYRALLAHSGLREAQLCRCHLWLPAAIPASGTCCGKAGDRPLADQLSLELSQGGENPEHQLSCGGRCVDSRSLAGEHSASWVLATNCLRDIRPVNRNSIASARLVLPLLLGPQTAAISEGRFRVCSTAP